MKNWHGGGRKAGNGRVKPPSCHKFAEGLALRKVLQDLFEASDKARSGLKPHPSSVLQGDGLPNAHHMSKLTVLGKLSFSFGGQGLDGSLQEVEKNPSKYAWKRRTQQEWFKQVSEGQPRRNILRAGT